jgi:alpha-glucosidase
MDLSSGAAARLLTIFLAGTMMAPAQDSVHTVASPDGRTTAQIATSGQLALSIAREGKQLLAPSAIALSVQGRGWLGRAPAVLDSRVREVNETIIPPVPEKRSKIPDRYRLLELKFAGDWGLEVRAYDDGVAYRFVTAFPETIRVMDEQAAFRFTEGDSVWFPEEESFLSHSERSYALLPVGSIADTQMCCLPAVVVTPAGTAVAVTEADLLDYPGLYLQGSGAGQPVLRSLLPRYPAEEELVEDRTRKVTRREEFLAVTRGTRSFPWRVFGIADREADLVSNDIVYRLGSPCAIGDTSWIRPGKVAWDWWNANNLAGVPFKSGINTETYKHFIDFASSHEIEYVIFDEGWSAPSDLFQVNPAMDLQALFTHARKQDVGIILWVTWNALEARMTEALDRFAAWGVKGIKVDFMQRDDQKMVNFYETVAREAAQRKLLVDFHGSFKPTGLSRTYPNVLTREGVKGLEHNKVSADVTPAHDVTIPFTRMFAGAMDYTPGAMVNASRESFRPVFEQPMSQGTRCHQLAMYVVYESPLQMLCDSPTRYALEPEMMEFLSAVPTTWDETVVVDGKIGEFIAVARRKDDTWYVGAMTDWTPRELTLDVGFAGECEVISYEDGINADRYGSDYQMRKSIIREGHPVTVRLAPGGGWVGVLSPFSPSRAR